MSPIYAPAAATDSARRFLRDDPVSLPVAFRPVQGAICVTCGTQFTPAATPPARCPVCEDERQYVGHDGQRWTSVPELGVTHRNSIRTVEPGLLGIGVEPPVAIGQRALFVERGRLLWDCVPMLGPEALALLDDLGGIDTIAISHPHFYTAMVEWADRFGARVVLHEADREWIMRASPRIELWSGERLELSPAIELIRLGGHFEGGTIALWRDGADGRGALLTSDIVSVVEDRDWASFMRSYPNLIPLPAREVARMRDVLSGLSFDRVYGAWWGSVMQGGAHAKTLRSADRYIEALE